MALPSSGPLSIGDIHTALGSSSYSLHTLSVAAGKGTPDAISEFYGYSANSVTFSGPTGYSQTPGGSYSGTVTITGSSASFAAYAQAAGFGTNSASASITVNGTSRSASRNQSSGGGTTYSSYFSLSPGTYSYSISVSIQSQYGASGGITYTQP